MRYKTKRWSILEVKDCADYVKDMLEDTSYGGRYRLHSVGQAEEVKAFLNNPQNTKKKAARVMTGIRGWNNQEVAYVPSNLGRGVLWYFICNNCGCRARLLYLYSDANSPLCRPCLGIDYERRKTVRRERPNEYPQIIQKNNPTIAVNRKRHGMAMIIHRADNVSWAL